MTDRRITLVQCLACGHTATMDRETDDLPLVRLTKRLVWSVCGARTMKAERIQIGDPAQSKPKTNLRCGFRRLPDRDAGSVLFQ